MIGFTHKISNDWYVRATVKVGPPTSDTYEVVTTPVHPDDTHLIQKEGVIVEFTVVTIATGTSEFDVTDMDVARIVKISKQ